MPTSFLSDAENFVLCCQGCVVLLYCVLLWDANVCSPRPQGGSGEEAALSHTAASVCLSYQGAPQDGVKVSLLPCFVLFLGFSVSFTPLTGSAWAHQAPKHADLAAVHSRRYQAPGLAAEMLCSQVGMLLKYLSVRSKIYKFLFSYWNKSSCKDNVALCSDLVHRILNSLLTHRHCISFLFASHYSSSCSYSCRPSQPHTTSQDQTIRPIFIIIIHRSLEWAQG